MNQTLFSLNGTECVLIETELAKVIQARAGEIGIGATNTLSCNTYNEIVENAPDMYFMHFSQTSKLQRILAKHHCPEMIDMPVVTNVDKEKGAEVWVKLENGNVTVGLDTWLEKKANLIEFLLRMRTSATCQRKTRHMEDEMFACSDMTIKADNVRQW
jgi:hypothetical protein